MTKANSEIDIAKLINEQLTSDKLKQEIELNNRKLQDTELDSKKLKQEVSWKKNVIPSLQIISSFGTAVSLILITYQLGFNSKAYKDDKRILDELEISISKKNTLIEDTEVLGKITMKNSEAALKASQDSISSHKSKIVKENDRLNSSNDELKIQFGGLKNEQSILVGQISTIQKDKQKALVSLRKVNIALDSLSDEIVFKEIASNIATLRYLPSVQDRASKQLISVLQSNGKFTKRLTDSLTELVRYADQHKSSAWGAANYILYFGTQNEYYRQQLTSQIENDLSSFDGMPKKINFYEMLTSDIYDKSESRDLEIALLTRLNENSTQLQRMAIITLIAQVQNAGEDDPIYKQNFAAYLTYLEACRLSYHSDEKNTIDKTQVMSCLSIMCPQITIARNILDNQNYAKDRSFKHSLKDTSEKFYPTFSSNQILNPAVKTRGHLIERSINFEKKYGKVGERFFNLNPENMRKVIFWNKWFFDNKPLDLVVLKQKILSETM